MSDQTHSPSVGMSYSCPLCGQRVSASVYQKITGIWEARQKALARIKDRRVRLLKRFEERERRLRKQADTFRKQKASLIHQAVDRRTKPLLSQIQSLRCKEREIEKRTRHKIQRAIVLARTHAERYWNRRVNSLRRELRTSVRDRVRKERERTTERVEKRYKRLRNSFNATLQQMEVKENRLREQARQIRELQRQLQRQTTPQIEGLLYEENLLRELQRRFPHDKLKHAGKSGDILHWPMRNNHVAGLLVYECKRVQQYLPSHVKQTADAKGKRKADFAILVTSAMKRKTHGFFVEKGVLVVHPAGVLHLANILREQIIHVAEMKLGQLQRNRAVKLTLEYLEGPEFTNSMDGIMQQALTLYDDLKHEVKTHVAVWRKRIAAYETVYEGASMVKSTTRALLSGEPEYKKLIQTEYLPPLLELPELEKSITSSEKADEASDREMRHATPDPEPAGT